MELKGQADFRSVFEEFRKHGMLLQSDARLPSLTRLVAGERVSGSWWSHPKAHAIFAIAEQLSDHPDTVTTKLLSGKRTYVHRKLWPQLFSIATAQAPWQLEGISQTALSLLKRVEGEGMIRSDHLRSSGGSGKASAGEAARELENKLLIHTEEFHTETGRHAKLLETWQAWSDRVGFLRQKMPVEEAREEFEALLAAWNNQFQAEGRLPWPP
jgi:hypothetical protein